MTSEIFSRDAALEILGFEIDMRLAVRCFAHGRDNDWEAICVDLDVAVQGTSFENVKATLDEAIRSYASAAMQEDDDTAKRLLHRRAPWYVTAKLSLGMALQGLLSRDDSGEVQASFGLPCPA